MFLEISQKFTEKHLCQSLLFNKVAVLRHTTLLEKRLWRREIYKNTFLTKLLDLLNYLVVDFFNKKLYYRCFGSPNCTLSIRLISLRSSFFLLTIYKILFCRSKYIRLFKANLSVYIAFCQVITYLWRKKEQKKKQKKQNKKQKKLLK